MNLFILQCFVNNTFKHTSKLYSTISTQYVSITLLLLVSCMHYVIIEKLHLVLHKRMIPVQDVYTSRAMDEKTN